jgi:hypothetical protein
MRTLFFSRCSHLLHSPSPAAIREGCMQSPSEVVSTVSVRVQLTSATPNPRLPTLNPAAKVQHGILLVGRNTPWASPLFKLIAKCGAEPVFASPRSATSEYVKKSGHALVLLESSVPPEHRKQLVSDLIGSGVSLFYAYPVEIGCWWLPALRYGKDCHGSPAFRAREFPLELKRLLQEPYTLPRSSSL